MMKMKTLIALLLSAVAVSAHAKLLAYVPNTDGGAIELHSEDCSKNLHAYVAGSHFMLTYGSGGVINNVGCWVLDSDARVIRAFWNDGSAAVYTHVEYPKK